MNATVDVEIALEDARWSNLGMHELAERAFAAAADKAGLAGDFEVSLLATSDARIADLNGTFRGKAKPTNVLSWPGEDLGPGIPGGAPTAPTYPELGDIALGYETCAREAMESGTDICDHVAHLLIHGFFHLLGYDHVRDEDATVMEALEIKTLESLGVKNPYK